MFHALSQAWSLFLTPSNALFGLLALGLLFSIGRPASWARVLVAISAGTLCVLAILPVGDQLLLVLEDRFPPPLHVPTRVSGILILGGGVTAWRTEAGIQSKPNEAAGRLFVAAALARAYPRARVAVIGGPVRPGVGAEADFASDYLQQLGVSRTRIIKERRSADTYQNAVFARETLKPTPGEQWLLVTSAYHMPRAIGAFRQAGFTVIAEPADPRGSPFAIRPNWSATGNLKAFDTAAREFVGLAAYHLSNRTDTAFPAP